MNRMTNKGTNKATNEADRMSFRDRLPVILLIAIPFAAVVMSSITAYFAYQGPDQEIRVDEAPMSKTSWRPAEDES